MNKMKPEDVMRALEKHADYENDNCFECPYKDHLSTEVGNCVDHLVRAALALLREKDAEIERLTNELDGQFEKWKILADKTERHYGELYEEAKQVVRAEAITEFAEKLKANRHELSDKYRKTIGIRVIFNVTDWIDHHLNEMTCGNDFPNCSISGCEGARKDCHIGCPYGKEDKHENS